MPKDKDKPSLKAVKRKIFGRKVKQLRKTSILPATVYGKKQKSVSIQIPQKEFAPVYAKVGETGLVELHIEGESQSRPVLIANVQTNPVSSAILHFDLHQVDLKEKISASVPVEMVGESPAVKDKIGILIQLLNEVEVEALPADLPEKLDVDIGSLKAVDDLLTVAALKPPAGVTVLTEDTQILAKIEPPAKEEVIEAPPAPEGEAAKPGETAETTAAEEQPTPPPPPSQEAAQPAEGK